MNSVKRISTLSALIIVSGLLNAQWTQTGGPVENTEGLLYFDHDTLNFVSSQCGIHQYNSVNSDWQLRTPLLSTCFTFYGDTLFFGSGYKANNVYKVDLQATSFEPTDAGLEYYNVFDLMESEAVIYAATDPGGFMFTNDFGNTWNKYNKGLPEDSAVTPIGTYYFNIVYSVDIIKERLFAGTRKGVYRTDINTLEWNPVNNGLTEEPITVMLAWNDNLYIAMANEVFMSKNYGDSWGRIFTSKDNITAIQGINKTIYVGTEGAGISYTSDEGNNWKSLISGLTDLNIVSLGKRGPMLIAGTKEHGFFFQDEGVWHDWNEGISCSQIREITASDNDIYANTNQSVFVSHDRGDTWVDITPPVEKRYFGSIASMGDTIFLVYTFFVPNPYFENNQKIIYTIDAGKTWNNMNSDVPYWGDDTYRLYVDGKRLYAREDEHMYFSEDLGITWNDMSLPEEFCNMFYGFGIAEDIPVAIACGNAEFLRYSQQDGWEAFGDGLNPNQSLYNMHFSYDAIFLENGNEDIFVSRNIGDTWEQVSPINIFPYAYTRHSASLGMNLFVTCQDGVALTTDYGQSWIDAGEGLINKNAGPVIIMNDTLYLGTYGNAVWRRDPKEFALGTGDNALREELRIYPNPTSGLIYIDYERKNKDPLSVQIFDLAGRSLYQKELSQIENQRVLVDLSHLHPGCYILTVNNIDHTASSKIIIHH